MKATGAFDLARRTQTRPPQSILSWLDRAPRLGAALSDPVTSAGAAYLISQLLSLYVEGADGVHLEPLSHLVEVKNGEVAGLIISNPNAHVFVGTGTDLKNVVISGSGEAYIFIGSDATLRNCDIACHSKRNIFVAGFSCKLEGLFVHIYGTIGAAILSPGVTTQKGGNFCVQENSYILLGSDSMLSNNVFIRTSDSHGIYDKASGERINAARSVILHQHTWISRAATLNKGTEIGEGSVVGQGTVANGQLKANSIYSGAPATLVRGDIVWDRRQALSLPATHDAAVSHFLASFQQNIQRLRTMEGAHHSTVIDGLSFALTQASDRAMTEILPQSEAERSLLQEVADLRHSLLVLSEAGRALLASTEQSDGVRSGTMVAASPRPPRVACLMMQRDETALLQPWIEYHAHLFGLENLYVWDNGSEAVSLKKLLVSYQKKGLNVYWALNNEIDFRRKGNILGEKIKELDLQDRYDFYLPIDCDEFLALRVGNDKITTDRQKIFDAFDALSGEKQALGMRLAYYNVLGHEGYYWPTTHKKTFFYKGTFGRMDRGYHEGQSRLAEGKRETDFVYMHYQNKPYTMLVEHSKNKLRPFMNVDDTEELKASYDTNRLARFILDGEDEYMKKFTTEDAIFLPEFRESFAKHGITPPFVDEGKR